MRLYHNPRCSKSRQAYNLLYNSGVEFEDYRYLKLGVHKNDISVLMEIEGVVRKNDLDKSIKFDSSDQSQIKNLLLSNPEVLQRPILINNGVAVIGRPPEKILTLLP